MLNLPYKIRINKSYESIIREQVKGLFISKPSLANNYGKFSHFPKLTFTVFFMLIWNHYIENLKLLMLKISF
jgi:hypothetical protein